jgi:DNA-binding transcriptional regulator YiaG
MNRQKIEGKKFLAVRTHLGLSRKALGAIFKKSITTIYCWEHGRTPIPKMAWLALDAVKSDARQRRASVRLRK